MHAARAPFAKFAAIGAAGFVVDAAVLQAAISGVGLSPYTARVVSYGAAATVTWWLNRRITFRAQASHDAVREWLRFLGANAAGGALNYAVFAALVASSAFFAGHPAVAVAAGSLSGLVCNFTLSRRLVFGAHASGEAFPPA